MHRNLVIQVLSAIAPVLVARLKNSPLGRRMAEGVFWSAAGAGGSRLLALLASVITARLLGKVLFGELGIIQSTSSMFGSLASFGMGLTAAKHVAEHRFSDPAQAGRIIGLSSAIAWGGGFLMALGVVCFAPWLAAHTLAAPHLTEMLQVGAVCVWFNVVCDAQLGTLNGFEAFRQRSLIQIVAGVVSFPMAIAGVWFWGLRGAVWAFAASQGAVVLMNHVQIRKLASQAGIAISWAVSARELRVLWTFSLPTLLGAAVYVPAMWAANAILVNAPQGYAAMGVFSAADRWRTAIVFLPNLLGGVALPVLSSLRGESNAGRYRRVLWANVGVSCAAALAVAVPVAFLSPWIMAGYGPQFAGEGGVLAGLCAVAVLTSSFWIIGQSLVSQGRMWFLFGLNLGWASILVGITWILREQGAMALVWAYLVADLARLVTVLSLSPWLARHIAQNLRN
jgi:O-antigen/teichoic acid export membrane protein